MAPGDESAHREEYPPDKAQAERNWQKKEMKRVHVLFLVFRVNI